MLPGGLQSFFLPAYSLAISESALHKEIEASDFLISDEKCTHRLVGLRYDSGRMSVPEISAVCARHEMALARQIAYSIGKKIFASHDYSASLFRNYCRGQKIAPEDYAEAARIYAVFLMGRDGGA